VKTEYTGQIDSRISWFGGQSYCRERYRKGNVAYSNFQNSTFIGSLWNLLSKTANVMLWFGARKRIWNWRTGEGLIVVLGRL
jgi:hypothetical protein